MSETNIQVGPKGGLISTAMYLAFGILIYMWLSTYVVFSWAAPMLYVYMAFWPIILFLHFIFYGVIFAAVVVGCWCTGRVLGWWD